MNAGPTHKSVDWLLEHAPLAEIGAGAMKTDLRSQLQAIGESDIPLSGVLKNGSFARACLAGLWLAYDFLDESHRISQELETREGSYWHGVMHRREGDFANSKYWFRRVGEHPIFPELHRGADIVAKDLGAAERFDMPSRWSAERFVDLCQQAMRSPATDGGERLTTLCRRVADLEWRLLFDYCRQRA